MTNSVFIVRGDNGKDYSDHGEWSVCACTTKVRAKEIAKELNSLTEIWSELNDRISTEFDVPYVASHPIDFDIPRPGASQELRELQAICANKATRSEHDLKRMKELDKEHNNNLAQWNRWYDTERRALYNKWHDDEVAARAQWMENNNEHKERLAWAEELDSHFGGNGYTYDVYELKVVE